MSQCLNSGFPTLPNSKHLVIKLELTCICTVSLTNLLNSSSLSDSHMAYVVFVAHSVVLRLYSATYYLHGFFIVNCNCSLFPHGINTHLDLNILFIPHGE